MSSHFWWQNFSNKHRRFFSEPLIWITIFFFFAFIGLVSLRPHGIFWSLDEGGKFIYMESVIRSGDPATTLSYPGRIIDPLAHFIPLYFQARVSDTEIYSWWPVGFPLITIPFYKGLGWLGLYLLPAAAGATTALFSGLVVRLLLPRKKGLEILTAILVAATTPVFYYSTMFWEHTLNTAFLICSIYYLVLASQQKPSRLGAWILAGGVASISVFFRVDTISIVGGIGLALLITNFRKAVGYGTGFALASFPWLVLNKLIMGDFFSRQMASIESQGWFIGFRTAGIKFIPYTLFNAPAVQALPIGRNLLILGTLLTIVAIVVPFLKRFKWIVLIAYVGLLAISMWALLNPVGYRSVHGFILVAPHVAFFAWFWNRFNIKKISFIELALLFGLIAYSVVYILKMWVAAGGQQWGPRYLLVVYPIIIIVSIVGLAQNWALFGKYFRVQIAVAYIALAMVGIGFEIRGEYWAQKTAEFYDASRKDILAFSDKPITTDCTFLPMLIPELYDRGNVFNRNGFDLRVWADEVRARGVRDYYDVQVDVCSFDRLDLVVKNRIHNSGGLTIKHYDIAEIK